MIPVRDLLRRLAVAIVGIPLVFFVLYQGGWILTGLLAVIAVMATRELYALASAKGTRAFYLLGAAGLTFLRADVVLQFGSLRFDLILNLALAGLVFTSIVLDARNAGGTKLEKL